MPKKHRPNCEKVDEDGFCPKGVPIFYAQNYDAWMVYSILLTQAVDSQSGIVRFNGQLIRDLCDLFGVTEDGYFSVAGKVLHMIEVVNSIRNKEMQLRIQRDKSKKGGRGDATTDPRTHLKKR